LPRIPIDFTRISRIYILHEPDQVKKLQQEGIGFYKDVHNTLRAMDYQGEIFCVHFKELTGCKDPGELHIREWDKAKDAARTRDAFRAILQDALDRAIPSGDEEIRAARPTEIDLCIFDADDAGNADAMNALYGHDFLYCASLGWLHYAGTHWN